jgi:hypothetical protein
MIYHYSIRDFNAEMLQRKEARADGRSYGWTWRVRGLPLDQAGIDKTAIA